MFFIQDNPRRILFSHFPFHTDCFVHKQHVFFLLNDRAVCILQINTFLYVLIIKYIVKHHIYNKMANWKFV